MSFRVFWSPSAEIGLERLVESSPDPQLLAAAARQLDQELMTAPESVGESRYDSIRVAFSFPIGVQFEVMADVRTVIVHSVWRIDQR
jgi:hypothetical protein